MKGIASGVQAIGFGQGPITGQTPAPAKAGSKHATHGMAGFFERKPTAHHNLQVCYFYWIFVK
jgi:hypothetical protein